MKKLIAFACASALALSLVGCGSTAYEENVTTELTEVESTNPVTEMELADIMTAMLDGVVNLPVVGDLVLDETNFEMYAFIPQAEGMEGLVSEAMIGSIAHSVVLVRVENEADAADVEAEILANANPRKWICVEAEKVVTRQFGDTIALIMSETQTANQIVSNLDALNGAETPAADVYDPDAVVENSDVENNDVENNMDMDDMGGHLGDPVPSQPDESAEEAVAVEPEYVAATVIPEPAPVTPEVVVPEVTPAPAPEVVAPEVTPAPTVAPEVTPEVAPEVTPEETAPATDLSAVMATIMNGVELPFAAGEMPVDESNFSFVAFTDYVEGYRATTSEAMMGSQAHSVVLVEVPEGTNVTDVASKIKANADPRKWICVEAETCEVATNGNYILLVMTYNEFAPTILANFAAM